MTKPSIFLAPTQQLASLLLAALLTAGVLFSLGVQADVSHHQATIQAATQSGSQQLSAAQVRAART